MARRSARQAAFAAVIAVVVLVGGCVAVQFVFNDYRRSPIEVGMFDTDPVIYLESGDELVVSLLGHPSHPDVAWAASSFDHGVVTLDDTVHTPQAGEPPPLAMLPAEVAAVYEAVPAADKVIHVDEDGRNRWYVPDTRLTFRGAALGSTIVALSFVVDGEELWSFSVPVTVVEDACAYFEGQESSVKVPHRCG